LLVACDSETTVDSSGILDPRSDGAAPVTGPSNLDADTLVRGIVAYNSCNGDDGPYRILTGIRGKQGGYPYPPFPWACMAGVTNGCPGVLECFGTVALQVGDVAGTCSGTVAIESTYRWDCSKVGGTCDKGQCTWPETPACDTSTLPPACDAEGRPVYCDSRLVNRGPSCSGLGLACKTDSFRAFCEGTGTACSARDSGEFAVDPIGVACDAGKLSACVHGGMATLDCAALGDGFTCQAANGAFFCGLASECDPLGDSIHCEGTSAVICDAGKKRSFDCTALGFKGCNGTRSIICSS
jgi:hypothetical protein